MRDRCAGVLPDEEVSRTVNVIWSWITAWIFPKKRLFPGELRSRRGIAAARKERERQGMKEITRKKFIGGMAATVALGWRGGVHEEARVADIGG